MSVVIVRTIDYETAGILSLVMSVTSSPVLVALFSIFENHLVDFTQNFWGQAFAKV